MNNHKATNSYENDCLSSSSQFISSSGEERVNESEANLNNCRYKIGIFDSSFFEDQTLEYDPRKPLPTPKKTHELFLRREFSENEKEDIWKNLELLRQHNQLDNHKQTEIIIQKAKEKGIYLFDIAYIGDDEE